MKIGESGGMIPVPKYRRCKKGGTHRVLTWRPVFQVAKKNSPKSVAVRDTTVQFGFGGVALAHPNDARGDWSYHVQCAYKDGSESWQMPMPAVITPVDKSNSIMGVTARVRDDRLFIAPTAPLGLTP